MSRHFFGPPWAVRRELAAGGGDGFLKTTLTHFDYVDAIMKTGMPPYGAGDIVEAAAKNEVASPPK
jgi:hypothetical protein